ncbi:MAG: SGNH/GDSL hydrolase family protein [Planctomycetota bacterium]|nr:MAG: SGNH/GDSL hydrolase family protein [Planctomycetota bacterium]
MNTIEMNRAVKCAERPLRRRAVRANRVLWLAAGLAVLWGTAAVAAEEKPAARRRARRPNPAFAKVVDDPKLPRVLIIGDSISIGYTVPLREALKGKANVHRIPVNGGPTTRGLQQIEQWLGDGRWDVIHFNWGLHDLKYIDQKGNLVDVEKGRQQVPLDEYEKNLRKLVERLKKTGAILIWRNTTPVPKGAKGRVPGDEIRYNAVAEKVMKDYGVIIEDAHGFVLPHLKEWQLPANVHFNAAGYKALADHAARTILEALRQSGKHGKKTDGQRTGR